MLFLNYALFVVIIVTAVVYLFFKTKQFRTTLPIRKKWYKAKAGVTLGCFITAFGLNTGMLYHDAVGVIVAASFILLGSVVISGQLKRVRHEGKYILEEYELNKA